MPRSGSSLGDGTAWAGGGQGQALVDAAVNALVQGLDSPKLRVLAGAPRAKAEQEATDLAPLVFEELELMVHDRLSAAALIAGATLKALRFLSGSGDPRELAKNLSQTYIHAGYPTELNGWSGIDDWYGMLDDGTIKGSVEEIDADVRRAAEDLVSVESVSQAAPGTANSAP